MESKLFELDAKMDVLRGKLSTFPERIIRDFQDRMDASWIFHEHALEGVVLSYSELKAAVDTRIISDVSLIPMYEEVKSHKQAVDFLRESAAAKKPPVMDLELIKKIYGIITPEAVAKGVAAPLAYRKENPLHRLYYHEISPPEKILPRMKKIQEWIESSEYTNLHPVVAGAKLQHKVLAVYPWTKNSGKLARLLTNYVLITNGYPPAIVHSIERQRYYEALRHENDTFVHLIVESLQNSIETAVKFYEELGGLRVKRAS